MSTSKVELKNRWLAALLAFLIPGAGHFYQGRRFKAAIYFVCVLLTFFWGMHLGQWQVVYFCWEPGHKTIGYFSQLFVGLPALPALVQARRYQAQSGPGPAQQGWEGRPGELQETITAPFSGRFVSKTSSGPLPDGRLVGQIELRSVPGEFGMEAKGAFRGTLNGNTPVTFELTGPVEVGPAVCATEGIPREVFESQEPHGPPRVFHRDKRYLKCDAVDTQSRFRSSAGSLEGTIPRGFWNWFEVPLDDPAREDLHRRLGKFVELAQIFTWIAGLLNLLAIWDALEGPAYGYGDEEEEEGSAKKEPESDQKSPASDSPANTGGSSAETVASSGSPAAPVRAP